MALTTPRWLIATTVACALLWFGLIGRLPGRPRAAKDAVPPAAPLAPAQKMRRTVERNLSLTNERLRLLDLRDSIAAASRNSAGFAVFIDNSFDANARRQLDSSITAKWRSIGLAPTAPVSIAIITDTIREPRGLPRVRGVGVTPVVAFLPSTDSNGRCIAILPLRWIITPSLPAANVRRLMNYLESPETISATIAPCAFVARFGPPGPGMNRWLGAGRWDDARLVGWSEPPPPWLSVVSAQDHRWLRNYAPLTEMTDNTWEIRQYLAPDGLACLAGEPNKCGTLLSTSQRNIDDSVWHSTIVQSSGTTPYTFYFGNNATSLGPASGWILSEMVRTLGDERFAALWRSPLPFDQSFNQAVPGGAEAWMHDWMTRMYGVARVGPGVNGNAFTTGTFVMLLGLAIAIIIGRRRRVM